jgi:hypothetical protein
MIALGCFSARYYAHSPLEFMTNRSVSQMCHSLLCIGFKGAVKIISGAQRESEHSVKVVMKWFGPVSTSD